MRAIRISIPQTFDEPDDNERNERRQSQAARQGGSGIPVFRSFSISDIWNRNDGADDSVNGGKVRIPSLVQSSGEVYYATPLPFLSVVVLSIAMLTEFLSANVAGSFMLFMVKAFGIFTEDSEVAFWTGILVAIFFLTQFLTSLIWAALAEKYSPRVVLILCLLGSALSTLAFGASDTLVAAMISRLAQGAFAGSIGVTKSSIGAVTDSSNEGRAYAILGFCWGFGGVAGAVIGGTFESPALKWPSIFETIPFFTDFPYLLPCLIASSVMVTGSFLACFLGPDLGPRTGKASLYQEKIIRVPLPAEETEGQDNNHSIRSIRNLSKKISGFVNNSFVSDSGERTPLLFSSHQASSQNTQDQVPTRNLNYASAPRHGYPLDRNETMTTDSALSRTTSRLYSSIGRRSARDASVGGILRRPGGGGSGFSRTGDVDVDVDVDVEGAPEDFRRPESSTAPGKRLSLIDRMVLANENAHMSGIVDFWVASAISLEGSDLYDAGVVEEPVDMPVDYNDDGNENDEDRGRGDTRSIPSRSSSTDQRPSRLNNRPFFGRQTSDSTVVPILPVLARASTPDRFFPRTETVDSTNNLRVEPVLRPIIESRQVSTYYPMAPEDDVEADENEGEIISSEGIPMLVTMQYGLLALHSTTYEQVFMSYLVTEYEGGGLNLNPGHFAQLIALMSAFQIFYQFYLYPNVGPPRGPLSYLTLFRLGCLLFIPSYLSVIFYRSAFASPDGHGNSMLMLALTGSTALRYCGITFGYTSISIMLNYVTPPHALGYANGVAQSIVSLARCVGPIVGGWLWSYSTQDDPSGYYLGFVVCAAFCAVAVSHSFMIR